MTADPQKIHSAYTINELSCIEAIELCNFGAKVIYPPTIYPVCIKDILIIVKNTFNPSKPGTIIKNKIYNNTKNIKGISCISKTTLITVTGLSMVGVIGVNRRIFTALANNGVSVFLVSQASSENSTSIGMKDSDADETVKVLNEEFAKEIVDCTASKEFATLYQDFLEKNISVIAVNKIAVSSDYNIHKKLKDTALARGVKFIFKTNVGAGFPIISTTNDLKNSGDKILKIEAVLIGALNFVFNELSQNIPFSEAVKRAKDEGYSEPDPRMDFSGIDVIRKLIILTREAGYKAEQKDAKKNLFIPEKYFNGSLETFWKHPPELDKDFEMRRKQLETKKHEITFCGKKGIGTQRGFTQRYRKMASFLR